MERMDHETISRRLSAYMDGEVPAGERAGIERHLAECPACAATLVEYRSLSTAIRHQPAPAMPEALSQRLHGRIDQLSRRPLERFVGLLSGIAACLALMGGLMLMRTTAAVALAPPASWEGQAVGIADDSAPAGDRDTAIDQWMVSNLSVTGDAHD
jgi:anti-sigma factor RsiW